MLHGYYVFENDLEYFLKFLVYCASIGIKGTHGGYFNCYTNRNKILIL